MLRRKCWPPSFSVSVFLSIGKDTDVIWSLCFIYISLHIPRIFIAKSIVQSFLWLEKDCLGLLQNTSPYPKVSLLKKKNQWARKGAMKCIWPRGFLVPMIPRLSLVISPWVECLRGVFGGSKNFKANFDYPKYFLLLILFSFPVRYHSCHMRPPCQDGHQFVWPERLFI